jgi:hypothetical protein
VKSVAASSWGRVRGTGLLIDRTVFGGDGDHCLAYVVPSCFRGAVFVTRSDDGYFFGHKKAARVSLRGFGIGDASNYFAAFLRASALLVISQVMSGSLILPK